MGVVAGMVADGEGSLVAGSGREEEDFVKQVGEAQVCGGSGAESEGLDDLYVFDVGGCHSH